MSTVMRLWSWYAHSAGLLLLVMALSYGVLHMLAVTGPVVEVLEGPARKTVIVPYAGEVSYQVTLKRNASCPGSYVTTFYSRNGGAPNNVVISRPIVSTEIKTTDDVTVRVMLPASVYPGQWLFQATIDSICPTFRRQDVIASFMVEVIK